MLNKTKSYKFVGGKFVERTAEELARLEQLKAEQAKRAPAKKRISRTDDWFARITAPQANKLFELEHVCWPVFAILLLERVRAGRKTFPLPTDTLAAVKGLSRTTLHRVLSQLEASGLISVTRNPPQPPLITTPE